MEPINPARIRKAIQLVDDVKKELEQALADAERPRSDPPHGPVRVRKPGWRGAKPRLGH